MICKPLYFYTIEEYDDIAKYCKRRGLKPYKTKVVELEGFEFEEPLQYIKGGVIYDVISSTDCYSGCYINLMRLPELSFEELINLAETTKHRCEREGAIGIVLKKHKKPFEKYLLDTLETNNIPQIIKIAKFVNSLTVDGIRRIPVEDSCTESILEICKTIQIKFDN